LADAATARSLLDRGVDPQLYRAYRDVVAPRPKPGQISGVAAGADAWFADLVVYSAATVAGGPELGRSLGHWNTPAQLELFQCLTGRVLMLHTNTDERGRRTLDVQVCVAGDHVVIPFGAWHLTAVLDAPAVVFNIYTDATLLAVGDQGAGEGDLDLGGGFLGGDHGGKPVPRYHVQHRDRAALGRGEVGEVVDPDHPWHQLGPLGERPPLSPLPWRASGQVQPDVGEYPQHRGLADVDQLQPGAAVSQLAM
jgi:hypothetical protein